MKNIIATGFVADTEETATEFPSAGKNSADLRFQAVYWRCIASFFYTARVNNPDAELILFSNIAPPMVDRVDLSAVLRRLSVNVVNLPLTFRLPQDGISRWGSVFYVLDIIYWMLINRSNHRFALLDSDVVIAGNLEPLFAALANQPFGGYRIDYPDGHSVNGLTPRAAAAIASRLSQNRDLATLPIYGGELFLGYTAALAYWKEKIGCLWQECLNLARGEERITTEEHFWSIFYAIHSVNVVDQNPFIKRMATYRRFNTVVDGDQHKLIWHMPAEKKRGFADLFAYLKRRNFDIERDSNRLRDLMGRFLGVPRTSLRKQMRDDFRRLRMKIMR